MRLSEIALAVEYLALTPVAPLVEWLRTHRKSGGIVWLCVLHFLACTAFWLSFVHDEWWQPLQLVVSTTSLVLLWVINLGRASAARAVLFDGPPGQIYHTCLMTLSPLNFVTAGPLWGKPNSDAKYGKWLVIIGASSAAAAVVAVVAIAPDYWRAWGCYSSLGIPTSLKYQRKGMCYNPVDVTGTPPVCVGRTAMGGGAQCNAAGVTYDDEVLRPFRGVLKWALLQLAIAYALFVSLVFRIGSGGTLRIANIKYLYAQGLER